MYLNVHVPIIVVLQKDEAFLEQLEIARLEQVGPLSAASLEMGSYQRGYEHIVRYGVGEINMR